MPNKGHMIVVEGLEGAGKSTALHTIKRCLSPIVPELVTTREPGGTEVGELVRQCVKGITVKEPIDVRAELLLFYAARVQLLNQVILPALDRGAWVLADRFELSTFAYQGGGRKLDPHLIATLSSFCLDHFKPDLILFLDITPEVGLARAQKRGRIDRIEQEALSFFHDVHASYHEQLCKMNNVVLIDAMQPLPVVQQTIRAHLKAYFDEHCIATSN